MILPAYLTTTLFHIGGKPITAVSLLGAVVSIIVAMGLGRLAARMITGRLVNQSAPTTTYRVRIGVGTAYGSDVEQVRDVLLGVGTSHPKVLAERAPEVFFRDFGESALMFELCVWLDDPHDEPAVTSDLRFAIDASFRAASIEIPFPQRDVHIRADGPTASMPSSKGA